MFDIQKILRRSWHSLWNYRILRVFGFILGLAVGGNRFGNNSNYTLNDRQENRPEFNGRGWEGLQGDTLSEKLNDAFRQLGAGIQQLQAEYPVEFRMGVAAAITFFIVVLLLSIVMAFLRYMAETASIRMVDEYEQSGVKVGLRQGWRYGWSRAAWRVFLVNFLVHLPVLALFVVIGLVAWWVIASILSGAETAIISSLIAGSGLVFLGIFGTVILMAVLYVVRDIAWRIIVLDGAQTMESLRLAWAMVRRQWRNVGLMWLVMVGLKILWGVAFIILIFPLLIVSIITALGGAAVAIVPSLVTAGIASLFSAPDYWPWVFAAIIGLPFFFVVAFSPILLVSGWSQIYQTSVWTLTYRELKALETVAPEAA